MSEASESMTDLWRSLSRRLDALTAVLAGQTASLAVLVSFLTDKGVLTREEVAVILQAHASVREAGVGLDEVREWVQRQLGSRRAPGAVPPAPPD